MKMEQKLTRLSALPNEEGSSMEEADIRESATEAGATPSAGDGGAHNRGDHRQRTLKAARVLLTDSSTIDCTIRDISKGGARLAFGDAFPLPNEFRLLLVQTNTIVPVKLLWQRGKTAGVGFTGPEEPAHARK